MVDSAIGFNAELRTSCDRDSCGSSGFLGIVAAEISTCHIRYWGLGIVVVCLTDIDPLRSDGTADNQRGECI